MGVSASTLPSGSFDEAEGVCPVEDAYCITFSFAPILPIPGQICFPVVILDLLGDFFEHNARSIPTAATVQLVAGERGKAVVLKKPLTIPFQYKHLERTITIPAGKYVPKGGTIYLPNVDIK